MSGNEATSGDEALRGLCLALDDLLCAHQNDADGAERGGTKAPDWMGVAIAHPPLAALARLHQLGPTEVGLIVVAAATEVSAHYGKIFANLQGDCSRRRPGLDFAISLLVQDPTERLSMRLRLEQPGGLLATGIISLVGGAPVPSAEVKLDQQVLRLLRLDGTGIDPRLDGARIYRDNHEQAKALIPDATRDRLALFAAQKGHGLHVRTASPAMARLAAGLVASPMGRTILEVPLSSANPSLVLRECAYFGHVPLFPVPGAAPVPADLIRLALEQGVPILTYGPDRWEEVDEAPLGPAEIELRRLSANARETLWSTALTAIGREVPDDLPSLAGRFALGPEAIAAAVAQASATSGKQIPMAALSAAARRQTGQALGKLAVRIEPKRRWEDLVLPAEVETRLREISARLKLSETVLDAWGFGEKSRQARRTAALFAGPSGTGKTLAAEVLSGDVGVDLYRVDLAQVVDKYVGETEKNLNRIFDAAEEQDCLLFFDECEVLLGKRSEQKEGRDKYSNLEAAFLLQRIDEFQGTVLMATNLLSNVDEAFIRRLDFVVHFPFPDEEQRRALWEASCTDALPLADDVDFGRLAHDHRLSGGNIANVVLAAAYLAADAGTPVSQALLQHAVRREYQKMGQRGARA